MSKMGDLTVDKLVVNDWSERMSHCPNTLDLTFRRLSYSVGKGKFYHFILIFNNQLPSILNRNFKLEFLRIVHLKRIEVHDALFTPSGNSRFPCL